MKYKVNILTKCENEEETVVVIAAALSTVYSDKDKTSDSLVVRNIKRNQGGLLPWNIIARHERFERRGGK